MSDDSQETRDQVLSGRQQSSDARKGYGYRELVVWQKSMELAKRIYRVHAEFYERREIRFGVAGAPCSGIHSFQYCGGPSKAHHQGIHSVRFARRGFASGARHSAPAGSRPLLVCKRRNDGDRRTNRRDTEDAKRTPAEPFGKGKMTWVLSLVSGLSSLVGCFTNDANPIR